MLSCLSEHYQPLQWPSGILILNFVRRLKEVREASAIVIPGILENGGWAQVDEREVGEKEEGKKGREIMG